MRVTNLITLGFLSAALSAAPVQAQDLSSVVETKSTKIKASAASRDAATHAEIVKKASKQSDVDFFAQFEPSEEPDPTKAQAPRDLIKQSDILCFGGMATLIPKHAVVHVPENLKSRLEIKSKAKVVTWLDFYAKNRGWITTMEVNLSQAEGKQPFAEDKLEWIESSGKIIVATLKGGPISVLPASTATPEVAAK